MKDETPWMKRLVIVIGCSCLILIAFVAVIATTNYVQSIRSLVRSTTTANVGELTASKAQYLDEKIRAELLSLQSLAAYISSGSDTSFNAELIENYGAQHNATNMWVWGADGKRWGTRSESENRAFPVTEALFESALQGETCISDVYIGKLGKRHVLLQTPIYMEGKVVGGLYESYPVELLQNTYGDTTYSDAGYSYVLDSQGSIVLAPVRFSSLQIYSNIRDVLESGQNSPDAISEFMDALQSGAKGSATFQFEGKSQFLSFIPLEEKNGWYFVTVIPLSMVEKDGAVIVNLTVRMSVVIILAVAIVFALAIVAAYFRNRGRREYELYIRNIYQAISQNIDTVIFIVDAKTSQIEYTFENAQEVLGIPGEAFSEPDSMESEFQHALQKRLREERPAEKTVWELSYFNDVLGKHMWLKLTALPVKLRGESKYIFAATDVTEYRKTQENLNAAVAAAEQANAAKSRFLSNMSHDIRTPMNAIVGMTKLAEIHIEDRSRVEDCLRKIGFSSKHLLSLINDVLDMSKIESGKMTLSAEAFSLAELVESDIAIAQPQCRVKGQSFTVETKDIRHERLEGDTLRLNQVFLNLISNAVKFTPENGRITFSIEELTQKHTGYAAYRFQISDSGIGIAPEFLPNIFTPFSREATSTVSHIEGTGLGLAISKNIVEAMGGQISVASTVGRGTAFTVELEFKLQPGTENDIDTGKVLKGRKALLVEDSPADLELLKTYLEDFGMSVDTAESGEDAVDAVQTGKSYDLFLIDWMLPGIDGLEATRRIRAAVSGTPRIILITAYDDSALEAGTTEQPVDAVMQKPIFKSVLCKKLTKLFSVEEDDIAGLPAQDVLRGKRFLLAEDNALNREIAVELFELSGASVETAENGKLAVEAFEAAVPGHYDAVFMDIQMPVMDGLEAAKQIRASQHPQAKAIPIIAMSANVFAEDVHASQNSGMNAHTGKPIDLDEVCRILEEVLPSDKG